MIKLLIVLALISPYAYAQNGFGLKHHRVQMTGAAVALGSSCGAGEEQFARDIVIQNQDGNANIAVGGSTVVDDESQGGILVAGGSAISLTQLLNSGDFYDLCKIYADGTNLEYVSVSYVSR